MCITVTHCSQQLLCLHTSGMSDTLLSAGIHTAPLKLQLAFAILYLNSRWDWQFMLLSAPVDMRPFLVDTRPFLCTNLSFFSGTLFDTRVTSIQQIHPTRKQQRPEKALKLYPSYKATVYTKRRGILSGQGWNAYSSNDQWPVMLSSIAACHCWHHTSFCCHMVSDTIVEKLK